MPIRQEKNGLRSYDRGIYTITYDPATHFRPGRQDGATLTDKFDSRPFASLLIREIYAIAPCLVVFQLLCTSLRSIKPALNIYLSAILFATVRLRVLHCSFFRSNNFQVEHGSPVGVATRLPFILVGYGLNGLLAAVMVVIQLVSLWVSDRYATDIHP